jgi:hypothetical protein
MAELTLVKATKAERATNTRTEALLITPALVRGWENPPFQRPLRVNSKVTALAEVIKNTCVIPGIVTLGILKGKTYLLDGQHRRQAFLIADIPEGYVEVRMHWFESMPEMGAEFVQLNSALVRLRPDDILRGLEGSLESIQIIRKRCPFVGYDFVRRGDHAPVVSMSLIIRCWDASQNETPQPSGAGGTTSAQSRASSMTKGRGITLQRFSGGGLQRVGARCRIPATLGCPEPDAVRVALQAAGTPTVVGEVAAVGHRNFYQMHDVSVGERDLSRLARGPQPDRP